MQDVHVLLKGEAMTTLDSLSHIDLAVEAERLRVAESLEGRLVESLRLILDQIGAYEAAFQAQPAPKLAMSVLASLVRQALQHLHDLQTDLRPSLVEHAGLIPALEALAVHESRVRGVNVTLNAHHLPERPPYNAEMALYRAAQSAIWAAIGAGARRIEVLLSWREDGLHLTLTDDRPPNGVTITYTLSGTGHLTHRELEVLRLLAEGLSNKQIGARLNLSLRTVKFHLDNIYSKLGVNTRTEALLAAIRAGLLDGA
jgi:DNA-binding CsgD family transcriptional regulator